MMLCPTETRALDGEKPFLVIVTYIFEGASSFGVLVDFAVVLDSVCFCIAFPARSLSVVG